MEAGAPTSQPIHRNPCHDGDVSEQPTEHKILVVDDEPSIVDAVATALRYEGYEVEEAFTGRAALTSVARFEPDLVVLDWMLPDIEGIEVGRRLRAQGFKTAVLFLTAKDATENKVEALRAGGDDYVTKPFSLAELAARTQAILRRTMGARRGDVLSSAHLGTDETLSDEHQAFEGGPGGRRPPPGVYSELRANDGTTVLQPLSIELFRSQKSPSPPKLPQRISVPARANEGPDRAAYFTVSAQT